MASQVEENIDFYVRLIAGGACDLPGFLQASVGSCSSRDLPSLATVPFLHLSWHPGWSAGDCLVQTHHAPKPPSTSEGFPHCPIQSRQFLGGILGWVLFDASASGHVG